MEVHHHSSRHGGSKKKWAEYFWEFLMLFLAVFAGFLAENQREHIVEQSREKKYAASLLEDLKKDTLDLAIDIPFWEEYLDTIDTLRSEIEKPPAQRNELLLFKCARFMRFYDNFSYHDRTIDQLKNAGNFRLIHNRQISDQLIDYDASIRSELHDMEIQSNAIWQNLNFLQDRLFNSSLYKFYKYHQEKASLDSAAKLTPELIRIRNGKEDELFEYFNRLEYYRQLTEYRYHKNQDLLQRAIELIAMIKKEYHLE